MAYKSCSLPFTPCGAGWNRLLSGESAMAASAAAARGGDFLVAARGWGCAWGEDLLGSISGDGRTDGEEELPLRIRARERGGCVVGGGGRREEETGSLGKRYCSTTRLEIGRASCRERVSFVV